MITRLDARAPGRSVVERRDNRQKSIANGDLDAESAELPLSFGLKFFIFIRVKENWLCGSRELNIPRKDP